MQFKPNLYQKKWEASVDCGKLICNDLVLLFTQSAIYFEATQCTLA